MRGRCVPRGVGGEFGGELVEVVCGLLVGHALSVGRLGVRPREIWGRGEGLRTGAVEGVVFCTGVVLILSMN